ncbi:MAG: DNA gyrase subunit A [Bryobacteraceae bacterium]|nr:DNA gyrase subunit A [Bryobacteraceae bacterium]
MADENNPNQLPLGDTPKNLIPINIEDEMRRSYLDYAMSVIIGRALPDIRDGLKPVHRRILYMMSEMGLNYNRPTRKSARIVGDVVGKLHPHSPEAIYDALVRLAQPFTLRYPLVDGQGNFGSVDGDPPAAMRYTEARLSRIASALLEDIDKETVDFKPNYDDSETEPEVLPTRVPNLLINGSSGIAVGMATNMPPHNVSEIVQACILLVNKPDATLAEVMQLVPGPDFPTGGFILGRAGIVDAYTRGRGSIKMRARAFTEQMGKDREAIIVTEIPYQVNKAKLIADVAALVNEKRLEGISDARDESDRDGMRIVFELKRGEQAEVILNNLYKLTQMQINFGVINLAIVNGQPRELGLLDALRLFIDHRIEVVRRRTEYLLRKAREREHILLGFQRALDNLDAVIQLIRESRNPKEARDRLMAFDSPQEIATYTKLIGDALTQAQTAARFTERQAQAIIELQLQRLTGMEQQKILEELADIQKRIAEYLEILGSEKVLRALIVKELKEVEKDFGDKRRTEIVEDVGDFRLEDLVQMEDVAVTVTRSGYLKRTAVDTYRRQTRGGKGRIGMGTRAEDVVEYLVVASTHSYLLMFTSKGRVYWLKIYEIPDAQTAGKGKNISGLINLQPDETVKAFLAVKEFTPGRYIVMVTKQGTIKKCELTEFDNPMSKGIIAIGLEEGDELISARMTSGSDQILIATREGIAIRFNETDVRAMGRPAYGVRGINLSEEGDYVIGAEVVGPESLILSIAEHGYGKRTPVTDYREQTRGGKGVINMKVTNKTGKVVSILSITDDSDVIVITKDGKLIRTDTGEIRKSGRSSQGVRVVKMEEGDVVAAASIVPDSEVAANGEDGQGDLPLQ